MKKIVCGLLLLLMLSIVTIGCSKATGEDTRAIKSPTNNSLNIYGKWKIKSIKVFDKEINVFQDIDSINGKEIEFSNDKINFIDTVYLNPSYKLKVVDKDYILSYESNIKIEDFMDEKEKRDVISIISNNNMISEFILTEKDKGYIIYMGSLIEVYKVSNNTIPNTDDKIINDEVKDTADINYYESETGVMVGLKTPRIKNVDGTFTSEEYRTLWISFKDGKLMPIVEKKNIIFPRINGIWSLENKFSKIDKHYQEYFEVGSVDNKNISTYEIISNKAIFKNITFIGNNYIGIEEYSGENFNNIFTNYKVVPIDNINSSSGLKIEELYSKDINNKYEIEYKKALNDISLDKPSNTSDIDYNNFTVKRKEGKWQLVGSLGSVNKNGENEEYLLNLRPSNKMLNYDNLIIPWKMLKGDIPSIRDAYISPNQRIAIILFEDNLAIYEIKDKMLKGAPLANINIGNEQVIMSEWSTGGYVEKWAKVFNDGIDITN